MTIYIHILSLAHITFLIFFFFLLSSFLCFCFNSFFLLNKNSVSLVLVLVLMCSELWSLSICQHISSMLCLKNHTLESKLESQFIRLLFPITIAGCLQESNRNRTKIYIENKKFLQHHVQVYATGKKKCLNMK